MSFLGISLQIFIPIHFTDGKDDDDSMQVIEELEKIDDDCDKHGIQFVKIDDKGAAKEHGIKDVTATKTYQLSHSQDNFFLLSFPPSSSTKSKSQTAMRAT